ncbi:MAG TPA: glycosyltransferase family 4 protein [Acidimicrobiia bacterium]
MTAVQNTSEPRRLCTIAARNYEASTLLLVQSFAAHHPDVPITVLYVDARPGDAYPDYPCEVLGPDALPIDRDAFLRMATYYDVTELSTALKPLLLRHLLDRGAGCVMYLDPDIEVFAPIDDLFELAERDQIVLTPHVMRPMPRDGLNVREETIVSSGQFNLGFIAVDGRARPFLDYWWERTHLHSLSDHARGYFVDQRWVDVVPIYYEHAVCRDPACNVAYWNLHERVLDVHDDGSYTIDGTPLRFFHYSGHDARKPERLSRHVIEPERIVVAEHPALRRLLHERSARVRAFEPRRDTPLPYGWSRTRRGLALTKTIRRVYWDAVVDAEEDGSEPPPHAFEPDDGAGFTEWLLEPAEPGALITRFLHAVWRDESHYQRLFPDPLGEDAEAFVDAGRVDVTLSMYELTPRDLRPPPWSVPGGLPGVNFVGYVDGAFGVASAGRMMARMITASGIPMATTVLRPPEHEHSHPYPTAMAGAPFNLSVLALNADGLLEFAKSPEFDAMRDRHRVGVWYWEIGALPKHMRPAYDLVDEIWCASEHVREALSGISDRPVLKHPLAIAAFGAPPLLTRTELGLLHDRFLFGFVFDYRSVLSRKNPLGLINAYRRAFGPDDGAALMLKTINSESAPDQAALVEITAAGRPDIHIVDRHLDDVAMHALFSLIDCYVSLHRSEGLGLTIATAMAAGTPAIATGFSGNLEFMDDDCAVLVPYSLVEVGHESAPYPPDALWAEPDLDAAAAAMRELFESPERAQELGTRGRDRIIDVADVQRAANWFAERFGMLTEIELKAS